MGLIDLSNLSGALLRIAEKAAEEEGDTKEIDSYKEVSIFKSEAQRQIDFSESDYTQEDINGIFGLEKHNHTEECYNGTLIVDNGVDGVIDSEAQEAYRNGQLDRAQVTQKTELLLGEALGKALADTEKSVNDFISSCIYIPPMDGKAESFTQMVQRFKEKASSADLLRGVQGGIHNELYRTPQSASSVGPKSEREFLEIAEDVLGMPVEEFIAQNEEKLAILEEFQSKSQYDVTPEDTQKLLEQCEDLMKKIAEFKTAMDEFLNDLMKEANGYIDSMNDTVDTCRSDIKRLKSNEEDNQGFVEEVQGQLVKPYFEEALHAVYRKNKESGIPNVNEDTVDVKTEKLINPTYGALIKKTYTNKETNEEHVEYYTVTGTKVQIDN